MTYITIQSLIVSELEKSENEIKHKQTNKTIINVQFICHIRIFK